MSLWKKSKPRFETPLHPVVYPAGVAVVTSKSKYLINRDGKRYRITSNRIFDSWNFPIVVVTTESALAKYPVAVTKLGFREGTLLNNIADGKMYLVSGSKLRRITSPDVFDRLGIKPSDALVVSEAEINIMEMGEDLD